MHRTLCSSIGQRTWLILSLLVLTLCLLMGSATPLHARAEGDDVLVNPLVVEKRVEVLSAQYPATVLYTIRLSYPLAAATGVDTAATINAELLDIFGPQWQLTGKIGVSAQGYVSTTRVSTKMINSPDGSGKVLQISWKGALGEGAVLEIKLPVHIGQLCGPQTALMTIRNTVEVKVPSSLPMTDNADFEMVCPLYGLDDIEVTQQLVEIEEGISSPRPDVIKDLHQFRHTITVTNHAPSPVFLALGLDYGMVDQGSEETAAPLMVQAICKGYLPLQPGESRSFETKMKPSAAFAPADMVVPDDAGQERQVLTRVRYTFTPPNVELACSQFAVLAPEKVGIDAARFLWRVWDVGDAPDSSNHFPSTPMEAYPGVQAKFATVADSTTIPEGTFGPRHVRPRPFHLGPNVDFEPDADLGRSPRNIEPLANLANQDEADDGVAPQRWILNDCQTSTIPVRVYVDAKAVQWFTKHQTVGYLNIWLDSIGATGQEKGPDGDWADQKMCQSGSGKAVTAFEHIVIDYPVDVVGLGEGLHTLNVTTGRVPWPIVEIGSPVWVRVTLSERESNKTLEWEGVRYGDGRGDHTPFVTGETEDYRLLTTGITGATADMAVEQQSHWRPALAGHHMGESSNLEPEDLNLAVRIKYTNLGLLAAQNVRLTIQVSAQDVEVILVPARTPGSVVQNEGVITVDLGQIDGGQHGSVLLLWQGEADQSYTSQVEVTSLEDSNAENNLAEVTIDANIPRLGFQIANMNGGASQAHDGTTCQRELHLSGVASADATVQIWDHMHKLHTAQADSNGRWAQTLTDLDDGVHLIAASVEKGPRQEMKLAVNGALSVDPLSLSFTDSSGLTFYADTLQWTQEGWQVDLPAGVYTVTLSTCGKTAGIALTIQINETTVELTDAEGDGVYTGVIVIEPPTAATRMDSALPVQLIVTDGDMETVYDGALSVIAHGKVEDASNGAPLSGADVVLLAAEPARNNANAEMLWYSGAAQAGINGAQSDAGGNYIITAPPGDYRLYASLDGFQPYRTDVFATEGAIHKTLALTPVIGKPADQIIEIGDGGFVPATVWVRPGTVLRVINTSTEEHTIVGVGWDSGVLLLGESYTIEVAEEGILTLQDRSASESIVVITVDPKAGAILYMPAISR